MNIYNDYLQTIRSAMASGKKMRPFNETLSHFDADLIKGQNYAEIKDQVAEKRLLPSLQEFAQELGLSANFDQQLGLHPDFAHLKHSKNIEKHYIVSVFIDIKGSTNLFRKYTPERVSLITNAIQKAAIHTCLIFGGYVQRLHGDGLFVYYGGKELDIATAVLRALQSCSAFSYFVKTDLKNLLSEEGIENIATRIGIDLGHEEDVVWSMAGIGEISEITTCSLHTSLASKMQGNAETNGIVVGDNVKAQALKWQDHFNPVSNRTKDERDRYIFKDPEEGFNYTQYDFNWLNFLKKQDFVATDLLGNLSLKRKVVRIEHRKPETLRPIAVISKPYSK